MFEAERRDMVERQLVARGIVDTRVLDAMRRVERHRFVKPELQDEAYEDHPVQVGHGQTVSQPYMVALMTQVLELSGEERVLEIGTGSGYQTAILCELVREVFTIERIGELLAQARAVLAELGYRNVKFKEGDGSLGWAEHSPYDRILVTAAAPKIPDALFRQLEIGGRMVIPVGGKLAQELCLVLKKADHQMQVYRRGGCVFVPLVGAEGWRVD